MIQVEMSRPFCGHKKRGRLAKVSLNLPLGEDDDKEDDEEDKELASIFVIL